MTMRTTFFLSNEDLYWSEVFEDYPKPDNEKANELLAVAGDKQRKNMANLLGTVDDAPWDDVVRLEEHEVATWLTLHPGDQAFVGFRLLGKQAEIEVIIDTADEEAWEAVNVAAIMEAAGIAPREDTE